MAKRISSEEKLLIQADLRRYGNQKETAKKFKRSLGSINAIWQEMQELNNFTEEEMARNSQEVNEIIAKDMPVSLKFLPREEAIDFLTEKGYQRQYLEMVPTSVKEFRIIQIDDWDWSSCGGTHVKSTGEVGKIKIVKRKNVGAEKERLYFNVIE